MLLFLSYNDDQTKSTPWTSLRTTKVKRHGTHDDQPWQAIALCHLRWTQGFMELGLDSIDVVQLVAKLNDKLQLQMPSTVIFDRNL